MSRVGFSFQNKLGKAGYLQQNSLLFFVFYVGVLRFCICFGFLFCFAFCVFAFRRCLTAGCVFRLVAEMGGFGSFIAFAFIVHFFC